MVNSAFSPYLPGHNGSKIKCTLQHTSLQALPLRGAVIHTGQPERFIKHGFGEKVTLANHIALNWMRHRSKVTYNLEAAL
jgi:hypothetical protein